MAKENGILCDHKQILDQITSENILVLTLQRVMGQWSSKLSSKS